MNICLSQCDLYMLDFFLSPFSFVFQMKHEKTDKHVISYCCLVGCVAPLSFVYVLYDLRKY